MGTWSMVHWIMVLLVVLLLFGGGGKLRSLGEDLGLGIKGFKKGMREGAVDGGPAEENSHLKNQAQLEQEPPKNP